MATSQRIQMLTSKSDEISLLMEFVKNPKMVIELENEVKKLNELTAEEEEKLHESKILIQRRDLLALEIKTQEAKLAADLDAFNKSIEKKNEEFNSFVALETKKIEDTNKLLDERAEKAAAEDVRLRQYDNKLKETAAKMQGLVGA